MVARRYYRQVTLHPDALRALVFLARGDMRIALNSLQAAVSGFGGTVSAEMIARVPSHFARVWGGSSARTQKRITY